MRQNFIERFILRPHGSRGEPCGLFVRPEPVFSISVKFRQTAPEELTFALELYKIDTTGERICAVLRGDRYPGTRDGAWALSFFVSEYKEDLQKLWITR